MYASLSPQLTNNSSSKNRKRTRHNSFHFCIQAFNNLNAIACKSELHCTALYEICYTALQLVHKDDTCCSGQQKYNLLYQSTPSIKNVKLSKLG